MKYNQDWVRFVNDGILWGYLVFICWALYYSLKKETK